MKIRLCQVLAALLLAFSFVPNLGAVIEEKEKAKSRAVLNVEEKKRVKRGATNVAPPKLKRSAVFAIEVERKLIDGIDKTLGFLRKTAAALPKKSDKRLQIKERILNLNLEQATYVRSEEERIYDRAWREWNANGRRGKEPQLNTTKSTTHWKSVIAEAKSILAEYPKTRSADVVTFNMAIGLQYLGQEKESARIFTQLIQSYPNSPISGDAYAALGDYYFDNNDFRNAQNNFKNATRFKRAKRYLWSVFKLGWCSYNLGRYKEALGYWKSLVAQARNKAGEMLKEEALRDMVYAFAEIKDIDGAIAYYRANGGKEYIGPFLLLLANTLAEQGSYAESIGVLKRFQNVEPMSPEAPNAQKEVVGLLYELNKIDLVWKELAAFNGMYGRESQWAKMQTDKKTILETHEMIKEQTLYYAKVIHQKAIKDNNKELNEEAKKGYLLFLKTYDGAREEAEVKYLIADIEYFLKNYREAGSYYLSIVQLGKEKAQRFDPKTKKPINMHKEASVDMVRAFREEFKPEFSALVKRQPDFKKPREISSSARNFIKACAEYVKYYPDDKKNKKGCETDITKIYFHSGDRTNAIKYLKLLAVSYPNEKDGEQAVESLIPLFEGDRAGLKSITDEVLKYPQYQRGEIGKKLNALRRGAEKEEIAAEKDTSKRAKKFEAQALKYPNDAEADRLWFNAAVAYLESGEVNAAVNAYGMIVNKYPKSPQAKESLLQMAKIAEKHLDFDKAAQYYAEFSKRYPDTKEAPLALGHSCELLIAVNSARTLVACGAYLKTNAPEAVGLVERMIVNAEREKQYEQMANLIKVHYLPKYKLGPNQRIIAFYRILRASEGGPAAADAQSNIERTFAQSPDAVSGEALRYVGSIAFKKANAAMPKYQAIKLAGGSVDRLANSIGVKEQALVQLEAAYQKVVQTKDSYWGVAALTQLGQASEQFAAELQDPPAIQGAPKADVVKELEPRTKAMKERALKWYGAGQEILAKYNVYNEWSVKVISGLLRAKGDKLSFDDWIITPDFLGAEIPAGLAASLRGEP